MRKVTSNFLFTVIFSFLIVSVFGQKITNLETGSIPPANECLLPLGDIDGYKEFTIDSLVCNPMDSLELWLTDNESQTTKIISMHYYCGSDNVGGFSLNQINDQLDQSTAYESNGAPIGTNQGSAYSVTIVGSHIDSNGDLILDTVKISCANDTELGLVELYTRDEVRLDKLPAAWTTNEGDGQAANYPQDPTVEISIKTLDNKRSTTSRDVAQQTEAHYYHRVLQERSVGPNGRHPDISSAYNWVADKNLINKSNLVFVLESGSHPVDALVWSQPFAQKMSLRCDQVATPLVASDFIGLTVQQAEDLIRANYPCVIELDDASLPAGGAGIHFPNGFGDLQNIALIGVGSRYLVTAGGFVNSRETASNDCKIEFDNCLFFGGVWGIVATDTRIVNKSNIVFAHMQGDGSTGAGGPFQLTGGRFTSQDPSKDIQAYIPGSDYFINAEDSNIDFAGGCTAIGMENLVTTNGKGAYVNIVDGVFSEGQRIVHAGEQSGINFTNSSFTTINTAGTNEQLWVAPSFGFGALPVTIFVGSNSTVDFNNCTFDDITAQRFIYNHFGRLRMEGITVSNFNFTHPSLGAGHSVGGITSMTGSFTNPAFSANFTTGDMGFSDISGMTGITSSPPVGTNTTDAKVN